MLVATVVLVLGAWIPLIVFARPLIVVVPVPFGRAEADNISGNGG